LGSPQVLRELDFKCDRHTFEKCMAVSREGMPSDELDVAHHINIG